MTLGRTKASLTKLFQEFWNIPDVLVCLLREPTPSSIVLCLDHGRLCFSSRHLARPCPMIETNLEAHIPCHYRSCNTIQLILLAYPQSPLVPISNLIDISIRKPGQDQPKLFTESEYLVTNLENIVEKMCSGNTKTRVGSRFY